MTTYRTAFFVGVPDQEELTLLTMLEQQYQIYVFSKASEVYQRLSVIFPHVVMFSRHHADAHTVELFRDLRRRERVCVIVCLDQTLEAFTGKNYLHRNSASKDQEGLDALLRWAKYVHLDSFERLLKEQQQIIMTPYTIGHLIDDLCAFVGRQMATYRSGFATRTSFSQAYDELP